MTRNMTWNESGNERATLYVNGWTARSSSGTWSSGGNRCPHQFRFPHARNLATFCEGGGVRHGARVIENATWSMGGMYLSVVALGGRMDGRGKCRDGRHDRGQSRLVWRSVAAECESATVRSNGSTSGVVPYHDHYERELHVENVNGSVQVALTAQPSQWHHQSDHRSCGRLLCALRTPPRTPGLPFPGFGPLHLPSVPNLSNEYKTRTLSE